jgi:hypothetical protein
MTVYASLAQAKYELREDATVADVVNDPRFIEKLQIASRMAETRTGYFFAPTVKTDYYDSLGHHIDDTYGLLHLRVPLLEVTEVKTGLEADGTGGTVLAYGTDYVTHPRGAAHSPSLRRIAGRWSDSASAFVESIKITGVWGFHRDYASAWLDSGATVATTLASTTATSLIVSATTTFSVGQLLRLVTSGVSEYLYVSAISGTTLTVARAQRGSTASAHTSGTTISIWQPETEIAAAVARLAGWLYRRRGQYERLTFDGISSVRYPEDVPLDIDTVLMQFADNRSTGV